MPGYLTDYPSYIGNNGYVSWRVTPEWMLYNNGPQVVKLWADGSNMQNLCFFNTISTTYYSLPWACSSPDGTKLVYRSTMTGNVEFYQAVVSKPLPPVNVAAKARGAAVELTWEAPTFSREIAGYLVYRSKESGRGYRQLTPQPVAQTRFLDEDAPKGRAFYYLITSVEHSGLESGCSAEVCAGPGWLGAVRHFYEAEFAALEQPVLLRRSPLDASNMHYVSSSDYLRDKLQKPGSATFTLRAPKSATYRLLGRARVKEGAKQVTAKLSLDEKPVGEWKLEGNAWVWTLAVQLALAEGQHRLQWSPDDSAFELDRICLTDDAKFAPHGFGLCDDVPPARVEGVKAMADGAFAIALSWQTDKSVDLSHYNVYASRQPGREPSQATRVASVFKPSFLDWGLRSGTSYAYRVTAVDRAGNEGPPSAEVIAQSEALTTATALVEAETGQVFGEVRLTDDPEAAGKKAVWIPELGTTGTPTRFVPGKATGGLTVEFPAPVDGTYVVWGRFRSIWREARLTLTIDGNAREAKTWPITFGYRHEKAYMIWGRGASTSYIYCWCVARTNTCPDPRPFLFKLTKGQHWLELSGIGEGLSVDQIAITNDFSWMPEGVRNYY